MQQPKLVLLLIVFSTSVGAEKPHTFIVRRPTVVAFFSPVTAANLKTDPATNEALADFQFYNARISESLLKEGIDFHEVYALSFRIRIGAKITTFHQGEIQVGYYFIAPGRAPRIEYGVMGYAPIDFAHEYFGAITK